MSATKINKAFLLSKALQYKPLVITISSVLATSVSTITLAAEIYVDIPAQALGSALKTLGQQTGISVLYSPEDVNDQQSSRVQGLYTAEQALGQILSGTGVSFNLLDGAYLLVTQSTPSDVSLGPVRTSGQRGHLNNDSTVTENSGSYTTSAMSVATKIPASLKDTPRSVSIISNKQLKDQGLQSKNLEEVLRYTPGIVVDDSITGNATRNSDSNMPQIHSRGQRVTNIQIDGITYDLGGVNTQLAGNTQAGYYNSQASGVLTLPDMMLYDHVEILRGPNSVFSGNGTPSATVNMVRKRPLKYRQIQIEGNTSSWDSNFQKANYRTTIDVTSPLPVLDERIRTRFIVSQQDGAASFHDHHKSERETYYGAIDFEPNEKTLLGISYSKENTNSTQIPIGVGLPRYIWGGDIEISRRQNISTKQSYTKTDSDTLQIYATHELNKEWSIDFNASHLDQSLTNNDNILYTPGTVYSDNSGARLEFTPPQNKSISQNSLDIRISGNIEILNKKIQILSGIDSKHLDGKNKFDIYVDDSNQPAYLTPIEDITNISQYIKNPVPYMGGYQKIIDNQREIGLYSSIKINITDPLSLTITGRKARFRNKSIGSFDGTPYDFFNNTSAAYSENTGTVWQPITPTYSLAYNINKNLTSYFSYSESYQDQSTSRKGYLLDPSDSSSYIIGDKLDPATGKNYEIGLNGEFFDGKLNTYAVIYYMKRTDMASMLDFGPYRAGGTSTELGYTACCYANAGEQESKGLDVGISGEIYPGLQLSAGYTYNKNETKTGFYNSNIVEGGTESSKSHTRTPEHQLKFFSTYELQGNLRNWRLGLGAVIQSSAFSEGSVAEYLGYDFDYINSNGTTGKAVWSNDSYYANGKNGNFNNKQAYTLPYKFSQGGYATWNGMIEYTPTNHIALTLNGNNIFDRRYYRTIGRSTYGNYYGEPRNLSLTARITF